MTRLEHDTLVKAVAALNLADDERGERSVILRNHAMELLTILVEDTHVAEVVA